MKLIQAFSLFFICTFLHADEVLSFRSFSAQSTSPTQTSVTTCIDYDTTTADRTYTGGYAKETSGPFYEGVVLAMDRNTASPTQTFLARSSTSNVLIEDVCFHASTRRLFVTGTFSDSVEFIANSSTQFTLNEAGKHGFVAWIDQTNNWKGAFLVKDLLPSAVAVGVASNIYVAGHHVDSPVRKYGINGLRDAAWGTDYGTEALDGTELEYVNSPIFGESLVFYGKASGSLKLGILEVNTGLLRHDLYSIFIGGSSAVGGLTSLNDLREIHYAASFSGTTVTTESGGGSVTTSFPTSLLNTTRSFVNSIDLYSGEMGTEREVGSVHRNGSSLRVRAIDLAPDNTLAIAAQLSGEVKTGTAPPQACLNESAILYWSESMGNYYSVQTAVRSGSTQPNDLVSRGLIETYLVGQVAASSVVRVARYESPVNHNRGGQRSLEAVNF